MQNDILWESKGYSALFGVKIPWERYTLKQDALVVKKGILFVSTQEVPLYRIAAKEVNSNVLGRIFGCGTLHLMTKGRDIPDLWLKVKSPNKVLDMVNLAINAEHEAFIQSRNPQNAQSRNRQKKQRGR